MSKTVRRKSYTYYRHCKGWRNAAINKARSIPPNSYDDVYRSLEARKCEKYNEH